MVGFSKSKRGRDAYPARLETGTNQTSLSSEVAWLRYCRGALYPQSLPIPRLQHKHLQYNRTVVRVTALLRVETGTKPVSKGSDAAAFVFYV
ncbi:hypothetical protein J6590_063053 [Homalodisca vitripennis]|nr:hypothetical protein J6590_063053 [Homalodisca vitripennis]